MSGQSLVLSAGDRTVASLGRSAPEVYFPPTLDSSTPSARIDLFRSSLTAAEPVRSFPLFGPCCSRIHIRIRIPKRQSVLSASGHFHRQSRHESTLVLKQSSLVVSLVYCPDHTIMKFTPAVVVTFLALWESTLAGGIEVRISLSLRS